MYAGESRRNDWMLREPGTKYILSYGAGVNSTALLFFLVKNKYPLDYVVFADTGDELPETYAFLKLITRFLKDKKILMKVVKTPRQDTLYQRCERRRVIPSQVWRWCTRDLKVKPIHAFYRTFNEQIYQYIGIDYGEIQRIKDSGLVSVTNLYPLIDNKIDRNECINIIKNNNFPVPVKSGCYFCPFNNTSRWYEIYDKYPDLYEMAVKLEENGKHMPRQKLFPLTLRVLRDNFQNGKSNIQIQFDNPCGAECMT